MLVFEESGFTDLAAAKLEARKVRALADDLDRLVAGTAPRQEVLANAPSIDRWTVCIGQVPALQGIAIGHPAASAPIAAWRTSPIFVAAEELGWVRTWDGFWRLMTMEDGRNFPWNEPSLRIREWK